MIYLVLKKQAHRLSGPFDDELIPGIYLFRFGLITICFLFIKTNQTFFKYLYFQ